MADSTRTTTQLQSHSFLDLAGTKLRSRLSSQLNESASAGITNEFARKQLEKLGWKEGEGLGKSGSGIKTHIRAVKRADEQGGIGKSSLNEELSKSIGNEWWKSSVGDTLARLSSKSKKKSKKKKTTKTSYTDEELFQATGGARFGMRAQSSQKGKWKRTEVGNEEEEALAKTKMEWDGMSTPRVVLSSSSSEQPSNKRKLDDNDTDDDDSAEERKKRKEAKKKRRKEEKKQSSSGEKKKKKKKKTKE